MRCIFVVALAVLTCTIVIAADLGDLDAPGGLTAADYDRQGNQLLNTGNYTLALKYLTAAIRLEPDLWTAYYNRATVYLAQNNANAALQDLNETIRLKPAFFLASWMRGGVYSRMHNYKAALRDWDTLVRVTTQVQNAGELQLILNERAWLRATCPDASIRNGKLAVADAKRACQISNWKNSRNIDTLAAACAEAGDFDSAVRYEQQAIALNQSGNDEYLKSYSKKFAEQLGKRNPEHQKGFSERLESYRRHQPYRQR